LPSVLAGGIEATDLLVKLGLLEGNNLFEFLEYMLLEQSGWLLRVIEVTHKVAGILVHNLPYQL
jgi:hypothetical protein